MIMKNTFKKNLLFFVFGVFSLYIGSLALIYIVDPFYIFGSKFFKKDIFLSHGAFLDRGLIESFLAKKDDYDTLLLGSSHFMNTTNKDILEALNAKGCLRLCLWGASVPELECIAKKAISTGKVKNIIWGFEVFNYFEPSQRVFPYDIYKNKINSLFYIDHLFGTFSMIAEKMNLPFIFKLLNPNYTINIYKNIEDIFYYDDLPYIQRMFSRWTQPQSLAQLQGKYSFMKKYEIKPFEDCSFIRDHLIPIAKENPNVNFHILIAPNSWVFYKTNARLDAVFSWQKYLVQQCQDLPNVKVYGFHDCAFVNNLANYFDRSHYHPDVNRYMMFSIKNNLHRLTPENIDLYEQRMLENLKSFEIKENYPHMDSLEDLIRQEATK